MPGTPRGRHRSARKARSERAQWVQWLSTFGADKFYDAFMRTAQDAESRCFHCHWPIYLDIREGGGVPDWRTGYGDYGCDISPDATGTGTEDDPVVSGSHEPLRKKA